MTATAGRRAVPTSERLVWQRGEGGLVRRPDHLAVEEPLEIRLGGRGGEKSELLNVTMRTPGDDFELAAGWALSEGVLSGLEDFSAIRYCTDAELSEEQRYNAVTLDLTPARRASYLESERPQRRLTATTSSCGVCGSASIEALKGRCSPLAASEASFSLDSVANWPELLREEGQRGFALTGGLHAAGLVDRGGSLLVAREDIGRHNAVDKVFGWSLLEASAGRAQPMAELGLVVSGRTSFEIAQKALVAGVTVVAAVSAASSLAVRLAEENGLCLLGFVREGRATVYCHPERLS